MTRLSKNVGPYGLLTQKSASTSGPSDKDTQKSASASGPSGFTVDKSLSSEPERKETRKVLTQAAAADAATSSQASAPGGSLGDNDQDSFEPVIKPMMMLWGLEEKLTIYSVKKPGFAL